MGAEDMNGNRNHNERKNSLGRRETFPCGGCGREVPEWKTEGPGQGLIDINTSRANLGPTADLLDSVKGENGSEQMGGTTPPERME